MQLLFAGRLVVSGGWLDGCVMLREVEITSTKILSGGDFRAHQSPVVSIASDVIAEGKEEVVASCEEEGRVLIWSVSKRKKSSRDQRYFISRRPHRLFLLPPCPTRSYLVGISWQMGVLCAAVSEEIHIFSIEGNEKIRVIQISQSVPTGMGFGIDFLSLCNNGTIVVCGPNSSTGDVDSALASSTIASFTIGGHLSSLCELHSFATICFVPGKGDIVAVGFYDGSVCILESGSLHNIYSFTPHNSYTFCEYKSQIPSARSSDSTNATKNGILDIDFGPDPTHPSVLVVSSISGAVFVKALPDFISWEKNRVPSTLHQIASAPLQVECHFHVVLFFTHSHSH